MQNGMHPTKEQVRAYMHARESAHRPPPTPEEIRRQLGWYGAAEPHLLFPAGASLLFPSAIAQLATLLAVEWCFRVSGVSRWR